MKVGWSSRFIKESKRLSREEKKQLSVRVKWFQNNPNDSRLKNHPLAGKLQGYFSFSLTYSKRVVYFWTKKEEAVLIGVGGHDQIYR